MNYPKKSQERRTVAGSTKEQRRDLRLRALEDARQRVMGENPPERMDFLETSALIDRPIGTLYTWVRKKQIPHTRLGPRTVVFERTAILRWIEAQRVTVEAALG